MPQLDLFERIALAPSDHSAPARARASRLGDPGAYLPLRVGEHLPGLRAPFHPGRLARSALSVALCTFVFFSGLLGWYWWQSTQAPGWWAHAGLLPPDSAIRAEAVERGLTAALYTQNTPREPRTVELKAADANSWLTARMPKWLANRGDAWPSGLSAPRVAFNDDRVSVGVQLLETSESLARQRIVSLAFTPSLESAGALRLVDADARIGRVRLGGIAADLAALAGNRMDPSGTPIEALLEEAGGAVLREILLGLRPAMDPALVDLDDGRRVRILAISVLQDRLRVSYLTEIESSGLRAEAD